MGAAVIEAITFMYALRQPVYWTTPRRQEPVQQEVPALPVKPRPDFWRAPDGKLYQRLERA